MNSKVTLKDVANKANVSISTVSRYLNRSSFIVKERVDAIEKAIYDLGYEHKERKNGPQGKRHMTIGVMAPTYDSPHVIRMITGMKKVIDQSQYKLKIEISQWDIGREARIISHFMLQKVDAIIVIGGELSDKELKVISQNKPVLLLGHSKLTQLRTPNSKFPQLTIDNELGGYLATNHLIQLGHKKIAHIHGPLNNADARQRIEGYKRGLETAGLRVDEQLMLPGEFSLKGGFDATLRLIDSCVMFDSIFAANDETAYGAMQALYQRGISIPDDIAVIGFDDLPMSSYVIPPLSTINQPFEHMGEISIHYTLDLISGNKPNYILPVMNLIARNSTIKQSAVSKRR